MLALCKGENNLNYERRGLPARLWRELAGQFDFAVMGFDLRAEQICLRLDSN